MKLPHSPSALRNRGPILEILEQVLPATGTVLEVASGTGEHVMFFASALADLHWQPSDPDPQSRAAITARITGQGLRNVAPPLDLDVLAPWPPLEVDALIVANMFHISAAATLPALCQGAAATLRSGGILHVYGPFRRDGAHTAPGNAEFDRSLRARNPDWGIRDLEDLLGEAAQGGLELLHIFSMPANNLSVVFRQQGQITAGSVRPPSQP